MKHVLYAPLLALSLVAPTLAHAQDAESGEEIFKKCRACHSVGDGATNKVGPVLNGIIGRKAGTYPGFNYSDANHKAGESGWVWTEQKLDEYLADPRKAMPGNKMAFVGLKDPADRKDVIAYLKKFSK